MNGNKSGFDSLTGYLLKILGIHSVILGITYVLCFLSMEVKAQNIDSLLLCNSKLKEYKNEVETFSWDNIWFTESTLEADDSLTVNPLYYTKEKKRTLVASRTLQNAYLIWRYYKDTNSGFYNPQTAYLKTPSGKVLYDFVISFEKEAMIAELNDDMKKDLLLLYAQCDLWVKYVAEFGYMEAKKRGISPLPAGYTWCEI